MPLQETACANIMAKGEIANDEQLLHLSQCFKTYSKIVHSYIEMFHSFHMMCAAAALVYVGKG